MQAQEAIDDRSSRRVPELAQRGDQHRQVAWIGAQVEHLRREQRAGGLELHVRRGLGQRAGAGVAGSSRAQRREHGITAFLALVELVARGAAHRLRDVGRDA